MENENTEQTRADQEVPQPKKMSAKECVQQRLAGLVSGAVQPVKRGPGRPRGPNYGKGYQSRMDPNNPLSVARAEAGRKGQATIQSRVQKEAWRKRNGRVLQAVLDQEIAAVKEEVKTYKYAEKTFDQKDTSEFVDYCRVILEDCIWNRKWPIERDNFYDELENQVPQEERQFCSWWPEIAVTDVLIMARYVMAPDRPGLQKLALKTVESFIDWSKNQTASDLDKVVIRAKSMLPKLQNGSIYQGPDYDDPRLEPQAPPKTLEHQVAERQAWSLQGRDQISVTKLESPEERQLREAIGLESQVILRKQDAVEAEQRQQRQLLGSQFDDIQRMLHPGDDIFGSRPQRH